MRIIGRPIESNVRSRLLTFLILALFILQGIAMPVYGLEEDAAGPETPKGNVPAPTINRVAGDDRYDTSIAAADALLKELSLPGFKNIVLATGEEYPDALTGAYFAKLKNAPILLVSEKSVSKVLNYVRTHTVSGAKVYVLGGDKAVPNKVVNKFSAYSPVRLAGKDRYETNVKILNEIKKLNPDFASVAVCSGKNYADALSASALDMPLLLVADSLSTLQRRTLESIKDKKYRIIGGIKAVPNSVRTELKSFGGTTRTAGNTRYATAAAIVQTFFPKNKNEVLVASGDNFPDAIVAGPLSQVKGVPILLSSEKSAAQAYNYIVSKNIPTVTVMGGPQAVRENALGSGNPIGKVLIGNSHYSVKENYQLAQDEWFQYQGIKYYAGEGGVIKRSTANKAFGIDVSEFNGDIDWTKVKKAGVKYAFIRVGGRYGATGNIYTDYRASQNLKGASKAGIKIGVYFFTQAITEKEAVEEAEFTIKAIKNYKMSMPVVIDTESLSGSRHDRISREQRTKVVAAFCERVKKAGYTPMIYSGIFWCRDKLNMSDLTQYPLWVPQYYKECQYKGDYVCWQYTSTGKIDGIKGYTDLNWWYGGGI